MADVALKALEFGVPGLCARRLSDNAGTHLSRAAVGRVSAA
jgi:hypothetical protein